MLRVNVGLSRKLSKDYNSTGFSINLDGEVTAPTSDAEAVLVQVKELFDLAEEALDQQVERTQGDSAIASHDEVSNPPPPERRNGREPPHRNGHTHQSPTQNGNADDAATNKQINFLLSIGKRQRLSTIQLEHRIEEILGRTIGLYDLTKKDAARVIDELNAPVTNGRSRS